MPDSLYEEVMARGVDRYSLSGRYQLHHCLVTKKHVQGMKDDMRAKIHSCYNLLAIPEEDNISHANVPNTEEAYAMLRRYYSKEEIHDWLQTIEWKSGAPVILPEW